jgi:hypothetical protein
MLNLWIEFKLARVAGRTLGEFDTRTRLELVSAIGELNKCLKERHSQLLLSYDHFDSFLFTARTAFLPSQRKGEVKMAALRLIKTSLVDFLKYFREMNEVDFFGSERIGQISSLR